MIAISIATLAAIGFTGAALLALPGGRVPPEGGSYLAAVAAGILLALAFADLFPESLEMAGRGAIAGFIGGFALLFLVEAFTHAHAHRSSREEVHKHALGPFALGLAVHNFADGFVLGVGAKASAIAAGAVGLGVLVHQVPVGISLAAVLAAAHATRGRVARTAGSLGLVIPLAAALTIVSPTPNDQYLGVLTAVAGGVLAYMGAAHLLPEVQAERPSRTAGVVFVATLVMTTAALFTVLGD
jgi:zinc transporter ZupT